jgi:hypothetical protein
VNVGWLAEGWLCHQPLNPVHHWIKGGRLVSWLLLILS